MQSCYQQCPRRIIRLEQSLSKGQSPVVGGKGSRVTGNLTSKINGELSCSIDLASASHVIT